MKVKAAAYMRVSTEGQAGEDKYGIPAQKDELEAYALKHGIEIVAWYCDEGISGATLDDRPGPESYSDAG